MEICEFNPILNEAATGKHPDDCKNEAVWSVGRKNNYHVCDSCVKLPYFRRYRRKVRITGAK
jgi:hypothetical protein